MTHRMEDLPYGLAFAARVAGRLGESCASSAVLLVQSSGDRCHEFLPDWTMALVKPHIGAASIIGRIFGPTIVSRHAALSDLTQALLPA